MSPAHGDRRALTPRRLAFLLALPVLAGLGTAAATPKEDTCELVGVERVVAVGDVHGAYERFAAILQAAGLIDARQRWSGGRAHLVQTGDVLDRGPDSRKVLDLLRRLEGEAARVGGRVHALLGNHEVMRMLGDLRYVSPEEYEAFRSERSEELWDHLYHAELSEVRKRAKARGQAFEEKAFRERFKQKVPPGHVEMRVAFGREGDYGRWLRRRDTVVKIDGVVFLHGGLSPPTAEIGCRRINETVREEITERIERTRAAPAESLAARPDGPLWYRGLALEEETAFAPQLEATLSRLGAQAIVVGHTIVGGRISPRFGGRVFTIDTGMLTSYYPQGRPSALEIRGGRFTAIYEDRRDVLLEARPAALLR